MCFKKEDKLKKQQLELTSKIYKHSFLKVYRETTEQSSKFRYPNLENEKILSIKDIVQMNSNELRKFIFITCFDENKTIYY